MAGLPPASRDFGGGDHGVVLLVEFAAASYAADGPDDRVARLSEECRVDILPQPRPTGPVADSAAPGSATQRRFLEVKSRDDRHPLDVSASIRDAFGDRLATLLPVPFAIPALAPQSTPLPQEAAQSPDFHTLQLYAGPAPVGLGFSAIAALPGADGAGVTVIDLEGGWILGHEALRSVRYNLWGGAPSGVSGWIEHGTAVSSLLIAQRTGIGISGLVPAARGALMSIFAGTPPRQMIAQQIDAARALLGPGDVILVEVQRPGPATNFEDDPDQRGYLPASFWPDVRQSIQACIAAGITVVEVAGNGGVNLDDPALQNAFDQTGSTLDTLVATDSGGIMVGAGQAPIGTQVPHTRLDFSNYGNRLDCQAWGEAVVSAGYGDLWGGMASPTSYTRHFMGTSSAGPLITAVAVAVQGRHRRKFGAPLPPLVLRQALASFGLPQPDAAKGRIGPQPDLPDLFRQLDLL